jgi:hypothetical protein
MTGASISAAARSAALLAADAGGKEITMAHVIQGIHRQYKREARLLRPQELGCQGLSKLTDRVAALEKPQRPVNR